MTPNVASSTSFFKIRTARGTLGLKTLPFLLLQLSVLFVFTTHFSWGGLALCLGLWFVRQFAVTGVYHRYFSHKSYKMGRVTQFFMALLALTAAQKGPLWWAANHRHHHGYSDKDEDFHSPRHGFWHSHWLWFLYDESGDYDEKKIVDFAKYPELRLLDKFWYVPPTILGVGIYLIAGWHYVVWGFFVSTFILANLTYSINSITHVLGKQRYFSNDDSRNHWLFGLLLLGEGWHNNHHHYQQASRCGFYWWEVDITYYIIKLMSFVGLTYDLKPVPEAVLAEGRENDRARREARRAGARWQPAPRVNPRRPLSQATAGA